MVKISKKTNTSLIVGLSSMLLVGTLQAGGGIEIKANKGNAKLDCPGGIIQLGHVLSEDSSLFPFDPAPEIDIVFTHENDGFLLESVKTGTHTGTHLDAPIHFIDGARPLDELEATEFIWPAYVIDVTQRLADNGGIDTDNINNFFELSTADIQAYEDEFGDIKPGSMVLLRTGFDANFGGIARDGSGAIIIDQDGKYADDKFTYTAPGFSGEAVDWLFNNRSIAGIGSDSLGPDVFNSAMYANDELAFDATYTALLNGGVALPAVNNLSQLSVNRDLIISPAVRLADGSGYQVNPIACLGKPKKVKKAKDDAGDDDIIEIDIPQ